MCPLLVAVLMVGTVSIRAEVTGEAVVEHYANIAHAWFI
jgi:hypothetical protein